MGLFALISATEGYAEFTLNFAPNLAGRVSPGNPDLVSSNFYAVLDCNRGGVSSGCTNNNAGSSTEKTPFLQEVVSDGLNGYYHLIVGDPTQGFAQETYIRLGSTVWPNSQPSSSSSGSAGQSNGGGFSAATSGGNPLASGAISGSGGGNPERTQIRQLVNSADMSQEFLKSTFLNKPKITQTVTTSDMVSSFEVDMSAIRYRGAGATTTDAVITNKVTMIDSAASGNFDLAVNKQNSTVTAGKFSWAPGTGDGLSNGTYSYTNGAFNVNAIDWKVYYNPADNTCWSYRQNPGSTPCTP
jgi:hypothetical protein